MTSLHPVHRLSALLFLLMAMLALAACGSVPSDQAETSAIAADAGLGTRWGEDLASRVSTRQMRRADGRPVATELLRYAASAPEGRRLDELSLAQGQVGLRVLRADGSAWPLFRNGTAQVQGRDGARYILEYRNRSSRETYEVVATVDGLDVLNGQPGSIRNRGYVLRPGGVLRIQGFRQSEDAVAAFRFSSVAEAYAARSAAGSVANVGVIGTALFRLIDPANAAPVCQDLRCAFPGDPASGGSRYARPPAPNN